MHQSINAIDHVIMIVCIPYLRNISDPTQPNLHDVNLTHPALRINFICVPLFPFVLFTVFAHFDLFIHFIHLIHSIHFIHFISPFNRESKT